MSGNNPCRSDAGNGGNDGGGWRKMIMCLRLARNLCLALMVFAALPAFAQDTATDTPAGIEWEQGDIVELRTLDKITARIGRVEAKVGVPMRFGSLHITVHACTFRPPLRAPENAAFLEVKTVDHAGRVAEVPIFNGWMFASSPGVNALEHAIYDVSVLACRKA